MEKYYYFVSELPALMFGQKSSVGCDYFLSEAAKWCTSRDYRLLSQLTLTADSVEKGPVLLRGYQQFDIKVRQELAAFREAKQKGEDFSSGFLPDSILKEKNPLQREKNLMKYYWDFLDSRESGHYFDFEYLAIYYLKLLILRRLQETFDKEKGIRVFEDVVSVDLGEVVQEYIEPDQMNQMKKNQIG